MTDMRCHYYDGRTSRRRKATLAITAEGGLVVAIPGKERRLAYETVRIPGRVADTPRHIHLPDGGVCEVQDNDSLDTALASVRRDSEPRSERFGRLLHRLDSTWRGAAAALAVTAAILYSFTKWGAPAAATVVVAATPPEVEAVIGENLLTLFRQLRLLKPSALGPNRRNELLATFEEMRRQTGVENADLQFYSLGGPNAFALPGGTVVITDELVELAEDDEEIVAVLAHELGHVSGRHVMRRLAQTSSMLVLWTAFTGDAAAAALSILGPDQLLAMSYSRSFERDADQFAAEYLLQRGISPTRLADILQRLEAAHIDSGVPNWLASHPRTEERAREAAQAAQGGGADSKADE
jgi:predicted Zn-dependent protease